MCECSTQVLNRLEVAKDGRTAYERCKGKSAKMLGLEFGEKLLWKHRPRGNFQEKLNPKWSDGVYLGFKVQSQEIIIMDMETEKIKYTRTARRVPEEDRWSLSNVDLVKVVPWNFGAGDEEADGEIPEFDAKHGPATRLTAAEMEEIAARPDQHIAHKAHLKKEDFMKYGYTERCGGCSAMLRGMKAQPHSDSCRRRMENLLKDDVRVKNAKVRKDERDKKVQEEEPREEDAAAKRRKLADIENEAMETEDQDTLERLCKEYMDEHTLEILEGSLNEKEERGEK